MPYPRCWTIWLYLSQKGARFIDPMLLLRSDNLPEGANLQYEVSTATAMAFKVHLRSCNDKDFAVRYPAAVVKALSPCQTKP
jgi:hypothetical protein